MERLYAALIDITNSTDPVGSKYRKILEKEIWPQQEVEARCWAVVDAAKLLHEEGCRVPSHVTKAAYGNHGVDVADGSKFLLSERLDIVEQAL